MVYLKKYLHLLPLIILTVLLLYTVAVILFGTLMVDGRQFEYGFTLSHGLALGAILLCWVFVLLKPSFYMPTISMVLVVGVFSILNFTPSQLQFAGSANIGQGMFNLSISFQLPSFLILVLHLIVNRKELAVLYEKTAPKEEKHGNSKVEFFKKQFRKKSIIQLKDILRNSEKYQPDALEAARQLLAEQEGE